MTLGIYGAGALGKEILQVVNREKIEPYNEMVFIDDVIEQDMVDGIKVYTYESVKKKYRSTQIQIVIANGEPTYRQMLMERIENDQFSLTTIISSLAFVHENCTIGRGSVLFPFCVVTTGTSIGENSIIHNNSVLENDCIVGSNCFVSIGAFLGAYCKIGDKSFIGPKSCLKDRIEVGDESIVGMGSVVLESIGSGEVWVGNPARYLRENSRKFVF